MMRIRNSFFCNLLALLGPLWLAVPVRASDLPLEEIRLPAGFTISVFAEDVPGARSIAVGDKGTVFVGSRNQGAVYMVIDDDGDARADRVRVLAQSLLMPNGVAVHDGDLYVAEVSRIWRFDDIEDHLDDPPRPKLLYSDLPEIREHGWKFIGVGPDGRLYVPVGAPCDLCESVDEIYASIARLDPNGRRLEVVARGVRNTVGFDWHPETGQLWFTENGRDWLSDESPPDELNVLTEKGQHFGYPYCHGARISDPVFGEKRPCSAFVPPAIDLGPHVAALGMRFYDGAQFPPEYKHRILIAEHGSWNRRRRIGYRVTQVHLEGDKAVRYEPFAEGWLVGEEPWGRPVDVEVMADGSLLVSDDMASVLYRISYRR